MEIDHYEKLAKHLDDLPGGFPRTDSGVEIRILRRLFTSEEAELALHLTLIPEEPRVVARRAKIAVDEAARRLEEMNKKGLIMGVQHKGKPSLYMALQFVVGFWEAQVNKLNRELVEDFEEYLPSLIDAGTWAILPFSPDLAGVKQTLLSLKPTVFSTWSRLWKVTASCCILPQPCMITCVCPIPVPQRTRCSSPPTKSWLKSGCP